MIARALLLGAIMLSPAPSVAQSAPPLRGGLEAWGGLAGHSPQWGVLGETPDMSFAVVALRYSRAIGREPAPGALPEWEWTIDVIPVARMSTPLISLRGTGHPCVTAVLCVERPAVYDHGERFPVGSAYGVGIAPIGVVRRFRPALRVSPFVAVNGGALHFDRSVPTTKASRFNFTASGEVGVRLGPPTQPALTVSYRFHHISNGGTAGENPGLASHLFSVGIHRPLRGS